jgi:hypothetical protein
MRAAILAGLVAFGAGCAGELSDPDRFLEPTCTLGIDVEQELFIPTCGASGCHAAATPAASLDMTSDGVASRLVGRASACGSLLIDPDDPANSEILKRLSDSPECGSRMPLVGAPLSPEQVSCVRAWVFDALRSTAALTAESW